MTPHPPSRCFAAACALLAALVLSPAPAQEPVEACVEAIAAATSRARALQEERGIPGMAVAVAVVGSIVWSAGFGHADLEQHVPATASTLFRVGSVSKPITGAAVGVLVEQGLLDLDAPVQRYVPSFPEKDEGVITTRLAAGHLAGIRHYRGREFLSNARFASVVEGLRFFQDEPLLHPPGERFRYSTYTWTLVSAALEGASGKPFLDLMQEAVFASLGMVQTRADHPDEIILGRARCYQREADGRLRNATYVDNSYKWAGGGFLSSAEDLARFGVGLLEGRLLKPETLALLFTPMRTLDGSSTHYGIGWRSSRDRAGRRILQHGGSSVGGRAFLVLYPDHRAVVALACNVSHARGSPLSLPDAVSLAEPFLPPAEAEAKDG